MADFNPPLPACTVATAHGCNGGGELGPLFYEDPQQPTGYVIACDAWFSSQGAEHGPALPWPPAKQREMP